VSSAERRTFEILQMRTLVFSEQEARCWYCGEPLRYLHLELAHRVPQRKWCIQKWGKAAIHHRRNMVATHSGYCNSMAQLDPESKEAEALMASIRKELESEEGS
jgi:hypothetical protein